MCASDIAHDAGTCIAIEGLQCSRKRSNRWLPSLATSSFNDLQRASERGCTHLTVVFDNLELG